MKASNLAKNPIHRLHLVFKTLFNIIVTSVFTVFQAIFPAKFLARIMYNLSALFLNIEYRKGDVYGLGGETGGKETTGET